MKNTNIEVSVRMYRVKELGDCFLLKFSEGSNTCHVLIDCGSFRNKKPSIDRLNLVWQDIRKELKDQPLDVVVGTHQHNDHLSGFVHGYDKFKDIPVGQVWLSWLDNPRDGQARLIRKDQETTINKLTEFAKKLNASDFKGAAVTDKVVELLGFSTNLNSDPVVPAEGIRILKKAGNKPPDYLEPGEIVPLPKMEQEVKVYVLGPPKDKDLLHDIHASAKESYDPKLAAAKILAEKMLSAFSNHNGNGEAVEESHFPFNDHYKIPIDKFKKHSKNSAAVWKSYQDEEWRNIDEDWLDEAGNLALYMDRYTNNTSLVLAFHLVRAGKFMLFVGDAQTGNWNSWKDIKWQGDSQRLSITDLLNNTILYKVGHHCSHNATTVEGLEAMTDEQLVAFIPVDTSDPNITKKKGWKMPAKNLYRRISEKTKNRIVRMDTGFKNGSAPSRSNGKMHWNNLNLPHQLKETDLYLQYSFTL